LSLRRLKFISVTFNNNNNKKFRTRSVEKQRGMAFGFLKTATAVKKPDRLIDHLRMQFKMQREIPLLYLKINQLTLQRGGI